MNNLSVAAREQSNSMPDINVDSKQLGLNLDAHTLEAITEMKLSRFLDGIGTNYPKNLYDVIMMKIEKPLVKEILKRTNKNQVHSARILGINRNTLRKKMKMHELH